MNAEQQAIESIQDYIHRQGLAWAKDFIAGRKAWLDRKGIKASGALISSLESEVTQTLQQAALVKIEIAFEPYGRYLDMKNLHAPAGGDDYLKALQEWIEKKGFRQKWTNRFMAQRHLKTVPPDILSRLAWAVAVSRRQRVKRARKWYNKPKQASITELYNLVAADLPQLVADEIKKAFYGS